MDFFLKKDGEAFCEDVPLSAIAAEVGTPCYVYSKETLKRHLVELKEAFSSYPTILCYAVKANCNIHVLKTVFDHGFGADLVSIGELARSLHAGVDCQKVVFSGVGKGRDEIDRALQVGILAFNVESPFELDHIQEAASRRDLMATVSLRINPNIKAETNPKIATGMYSSKFGIPEKEAMAMAEAIRGLSHVQLKGVACHIGSQMTDLRPLQEAARRAAEFAKTLMARGHDLEWIDMGGGLGIRYEEEKPPTLAEYAKILVDEVRPTGLKLIVEPGRVVVGNVGVLMCKTMGVKTTPEKNFLVVDGAMNDLIRPSMYGSFHQIFPVKPSEKEEIVYDIVGPICETGDFLGKERRLPRLAEGDLIYIKGAGAYGSVMSSNYNSRPRAPEVMVSGGDWQVIRKRESIRSLWRLEE